MKGTPAQLEKIDVSTVKMIFPVPYSLALELLASSTDFYAPQHYLKQYRPTYNKDQKNYAAFEEANDNFNSSKPRLTAWDVKSFNDQRLVGERNPYYWKVDPAGRQLPYIDGIVFEIVTGVEIINLKAVVGEIDMQGRHMKMSNYTLLKESEEEGGYEIRLSKGEFGAFPVMVLNWDYVKIYSLHENDNRSENKSASCAKEIQKGKKSP